MSLNQTYLKYQERFRKYSESGDILDLNPEIRMSEV